MARDGQYREKTYLYRRCVSRDTFVSVSDRFIVLPQYRVSVSIKGVLCIANTSISILFLSTINLTRR